jgi:plasmid replication initiation protein
MAETKDTQGITPLLPERHKQLDFFVADIFDAAPKDDTASMEHPIFALRAGDTRTRRYEHGGTWLEIEPSSKGLATIHDKDLWIYCISQLVEAMNRGRKDVSRTVRFTAYDFLVTTNRPTSGLAYERMLEMFNRLAGTRIRTNFETAGRRERAWFGLLDSARVIERAGDGRMIAVEVTLPDWLYRAVQEMQVLTLHRDYFRLRKPLDRRIYELARKHCGRQQQWRISVKKLYEKSGSSAALKKFRFSLKVLANSDELPGYRVSLDADKDQVTFRLRPVD